MRISALPGDTIFWGLPTVRISAPPEAGPSGSRSPNFRVLDEPPTRTGRLHKPANAFLGNDLEDVTRLLHELRDGSRTALDEIFPKIYAELRAVARRELRREHQVRTIEATALVHEAYCKLVDQARVDWRDRHHFLSVAARAMRQALVDMARERLAKKRGGDWERVTLSGIGPGFEVPLRDLVALDQALDRLEQIEPRFRQVVELRYFAGLTVEEVATILGVAERTVHRDWIKARAWLYKEIYPDPAP